MTSPKNLCRRLPLKWLEMNLKLTDVIIILTAYFKITTTATETSLNNRFNEQDMYNIIAVHYVITLCSTTKQQQLNYDNFDSDKQS